MSQLTIRISGQADALITHLQKEIFNRRRKKVAPAGVVETLIESAAKSQSDKRFATSWKNLMADIEKAAGLVELHGSRPAGITEEEWALVLSYRSRHSASGGRRLARAVCPPSATSPPGPVAPKGSSGEPIPDPPAHDPRPHSPC